MGYVQDQRQRLADLDAELTWHGDHDIAAFIEGLSSAPAARASVPSQAAIEAERLAGWKQWIRNLHAQERQFVLDVVASVIAQERRRQKRELEKLSARIGRLESGANLGASPEAKVCIA